jgi:hypothetical protein
MFLCAATPGNRMARKRHPDVAQQFASEIGDTEIEVDDHSLHCGLPHNKLQRGRVAEWLMAPVLKTGVPERVSGVRIPPLPPSTLLSITYQRTSPRKWRFGGNFAKSILETILEKKR